MTTIDSLAARLLKVEQELREINASEARYRTLFANIPAAILQVDSSHMAKVFMDLKARGVTDIDTYLAQNPDLVEYANTSVMVKEVNDVALSIFGATDQSQLIGPVSYVFAASPGASEAVMSARFRGQPNLTQTIKIKTVDGRLIDALFMVSYPQKAAAFDRTILMIMDVTEQSRIERELKKMDEQFTRFARLSLLAELSGSIVHEVRQPLSVVLTDVTTTLRWLGRAEPNISKIRELMARIEESVHRASDVIQRVKDLSSKSQPTLSRCDINELITRSLHFVKLGAHGQTTNFLLDLDSSLPVVNVDPIQIQQLFVNLLMNAVQAATHSDHQRKIIVKSSRQADDIVVEIEDSGPGIPEGMEEEIFESFFTTKESGMGIGLSICRAIARSHGGEITATNAQTGSAILVVRLPTTFHE
ncbi:PAS domain-containing sensor histidine kinase [Endobacterium cereale]|uniref:PAS domain-containing sensor histidine kinase n=1 Tax=Endobacterium cereale TaxID=2663029 RepID=UPI002B46B98C|nr:ATP-binding protein [Endobacterium cereale]MEB2848095.1 ATP-binding protein [Endobacterium cereale]